MEDHGREIPGLFGGRGRLAEEKIRSTSIFAPKPASQVVPTIARNDDRLVDVAAEVMDEVERAERKFPPFNSGHEGHSIILEELEELWDEIKADRGYQESAYAEAKQVAAMGIRYMLMIRARRAKIRAAVLEMPIAA